MVSIDTKKLKKSPLAWAVGIVTTVGGLTALIEPLAQLLAQTAHMWYPAVSVFAGVVNPRLEIVSPEVATGMVVGGGLIYVGLKLRRLVEYVQRQYGGNS